MEYSLVRLKVTAMLCQSLFHSTRDALHKRLKRSTESDAHKEVKGKCNALVLLPEDNHNKTISQQKEIVVLTTVVQMCHNCILAIKSN